jgi:putative membrane protein
MTALADQQLAGIIMWIPASFIYVGAMLLILSEWLREPRATPVPARDAAPYLYPLH